MFKRQSQVHTKLAAAIVSALFLSLSAHAGLLGAGGVATGVTGSVVGGMNGRLGMGTPMPATAAAANAAVLFTGQSHMLGAFSAPSANAPGAAAGQAGAVVAGQVTGREAAVVSSIEDISQQAERLTRRGRTTGALVVEQATDAQGQVSSQVVRIKQSGETNAQTQVAAARSEANTLGAQASGTAASRNPQVFATGSASGSGSLQASSRDTSLSGGASARDTASVSD